jgi:hypothetical protein
MPSKEFWYAAGVAAGAGIAVYCGVKLYHAVNESYPEALPYHREPPRIRGYMTPCGFIPQDTDYDCDEYDYCEDYDDDDYEDYDECDEEEY